MNNKRLSLGLALAAGLLGGVLASYIALPALAQNQAPVTKEIRAQSFTLVDTSNHTIGSFTVESNPAPLPGGQSAPSPGSSAPRIVLRDGKGKELWSAGDGAQLKPISAN